MSLTSELKRVLARIILSNRVLLRAQHKIIYDPAFLKSLPINGELLDRILEDKHALRKLLEDPRCLDEIVSDDRLFNRIIQADTSAGVAPNPLDEPAQFAPRLPARESMANERDLIARVLDKIRPLEAKVSVIIPCYNYGEYVREAVASIMAQSYRDFEVIVVNDGSTDSETGPILEKLRTDRVRVLSQHNQGLSMARNNGAREATGDFVLFLDADDTLHEHALALMLYRFAIDPELSVVFPPQRFFGDQDLIWACQEFNAYDLMWANHLTVCIMIRREAFEASDQYQASMKYGYEDWEFVLALSRRGMRAGYMPVPVFNHRRHGRTMTHEAHDKKDFLYRQLRALNEPIYSIDSITERKHKWRPLISIIIPFYNSPKYLDETIASIEAQTLDDLEVILIDDGSTEPDALDRIERLQGEGRVRVVRMEHRGLPSARNRGALEARGDYIMFLDADDFMDPQMCETLAIRLLLAPQFAFAYCGVVHFGDVEGICIDEFSVKRLKREGYLAMTCLLRRDVFLDLGGMDESMLDNFEDYDFWLRLVENGYRGTLVAEAMFHYRRHPQGNMARIEKASTQKKRMSELHERHPKLFGAAADRSPVIVPLRDGAAAGEDLLKALDASFRANQIGPKIPYEGYRRKNTPNLFVSKYHNPDKINILYLIPHMVMGGADKVDLDILSGLDRKRFHVTLVVELEGPHEWHGRFREYVDDLFLRHNFLESEEQTDLFLDYLLYSRNIDIVLNRNSHMGYRAFNRWDDIHPEVRFADLLHLHNFGRDWVAKSAQYDGIIHRRYVVNEDLKDYMCDKYDTNPDSIRVIYCGADTDQWDPDRVERDRLRGEMKMPEGAALVGFLGRFSEQKDPARWLEVAAELHRRDSNIYFAMIGSGPLLSDCINSVSELGLADHVHFTGARSDVAELVIDLDCLLLLSSHEGLPLACFEAMSLGVPVVASDAGGTRECVTPDVGHILRIDAAVAEFADKVQSVLAELGEGPALRARNRRRIVENFTIEKMQRCYVREFEEMFAEVDRDKRLVERQIQLMHAPLFG